MLSSCKTLLFCIFVPLILEQGGVAAPIIGEIRSFAGVNLPSGWLACDGQQLEVAEPFLTLYSVIGTTFGSGGGTFALPNLNGRVAIGAGTSPVWATNYVLGFSAGEATVTLTTPNLPTHTHLFRTGTTVGVSNEINSNNIPCTSPNIPMYSIAASNFVHMHQNIIGNAGGNQGHTNMMPYLVSDL